MKLSFNLLDKKLTTVGGSNEVVEKVKVVRSGLNSSTIEGLAQCCCFHVVWILSKPYPTVHLNQFEKIKMSGSIFSSNIICYIYRWIIHFNFVIFVVLCCFCIYSCTKCNFLLRSVNRT